jgi:hypothetical protein
LVLAARHVKVCRAFCASSNACANHSYNERDKARLIFESFWRTIPFILFGCGLF